MGRHKKNSLSVTGGPISPDPLSTVDNVSPPEEFAEIIKEASKKDLAGKDLAGKENELKNNPLSATLPITLSPKRGRGRPQGHHGPYKKHNENFAGEPSHNGIIPLNTTSTQPKLNTQDKIKINEMAQSLISKGTRNLFSIVEFLTQKYTSLQLQGFADICEHDAIIQDMIKKFLIANGADIASIEPKYLFPLYIIYIASSVHLRNRYSNNGIAKDYLNKIPQQEFVNQFQDI